MNDQIKDPDYYSAFVGPGKKYDTGDPEKDKQALARAYLNIENHAKTLENEARDKERSNAALREIVEELKVQRFNDIPDGGTAPLTNAEPTQPSITKDDIKDTIDNVLTEREMVAKVTQTRDKSMELLKEEFGDTDLGLAFVSQLVDKDPSMKDILDTMSKTSPDSFIKFVRLHKNVSPQTNVPGTESAPPAHAIASSTGEITWAKAMEIRRKDPTLYNSMEFKAKLEAAALAAQQRGEDFYKT